MKIQESRFFFRSEVNYTLYNMTNENDIKYSTIQHEREKLKTTTKRSQLSKGHLERQPGNHLLDRAGRCKKMEREAIEIT